MREEIGVSAGGIDLVEGVSVLDADSSCTALQLLPLLCLPLSFPALLPFTSMRSTGFLPPLPERTQTINAPLRQASTASVRVLRQDSLTIGASGKFGFHIGKKVRKDMNAVSSVMEVQNATSRRLLQDYFRAQSGVPVDWRNGLDMRTLYPAQNPNYLEPRPWNTYETTTHTVRPFYQGAILDNRRHGALHLRAVLEPAAILLLLLLCDCPVLLLCD